MEVLQWLQKWYLSNCDEDWEHLFGIVIETIDNPGWFIKIDLVDTILEHKEFATVELNTSDDSYNKNDWFFCHVKDSTFYGSGDPLKLEKILEIFKEWAEQEKQT